MNKDCLQSITYLYAYDQHRYHARNVISLFAKITMRRDIIATRRAGVPTSVVKEIAPKCEQRSHEHAWMEVGTQLLISEKLDEKEKLYHIFKKLEKSEMIRITS
jgi:hypothetical protein